MPITPIALPSERKGGLRVRESLSQSTATAFQSCATTAGMTVLGMGTATGFGRNQYSMAAGDEGQRKAFLATATGEAYLLLTAGTATGMHVFTAADDFLLAEHYLSRWYVIVSSASLATST